MKPVSETTSHFQFSMLCNFFGCSGIPADTMLQPISVPTTFPASTTAASTSLPSVHVNRVFTPKSGYPGCRADAEGRLNILK
eukprot:2973983-Ditylum_brightwellii.AAC.1